MESRTVSMGPTWLLASHNPALVKYNVLALFTNLPVTIVPQTVGVVIGFNYICTILD